MEITRGVANADDILTSTLDKYRGNLTEQWVGGFVATRKMKESGNLKYEDGGNTIVEDLEYDDNDTAAFVAQTDTLSTAVNQILTQAKFSWSVLAGTVTLGDHDAAKNSGSSKMHDLLKVRLKNLENTFTKKMEVALVGQTTPNAQTPWSMIDIIDSSNPALGNYGDITRATYTWWAATETASGSMATQGLEDIRTAYFTTSRGQIDPVGFMLTSQTLYEAYNARLIPQERLAPKDKGDLEFTDLSFHGKPVFFSENMTSGVWLGVNPKYLKLTINSAMNMLNQPFVRAPGGQSKSAVIQTMLQVTCSRCASNFKLTGMTA